MKKYLISCLLLCALQVEPVLAQLNHLDYIRQNRPRTSRNAGFLIIGGGTDRWPQSVNALAPASNPWDTNYRYKSPLDFYQMGINCYGTGSTFDVGSLMASVDSVMAGPAEAVSRYYECGALSIDLALLNAS